MPHRQSVVTFDGSSAVENQCEAIERLMARIVKKVVRFLSRLATFLMVLFRHPILFREWVSTMPEFCRGLKFADSLSSTQSHGMEQDLSGNPLWQYFSKNQTGPGIWKWTHYFEAYHRHFSRFRGSRVNVLEIGIYSGGSLPMWLSYFGDQCKVYGVDIEIACKSYESDKVEVFIGDQEDREFWRRFRQSAPEIDILIDDGGHTVEQQIVTLEEMLPHMPIGSVYMCEDVHGKMNGFASFATAFVHRLNAMKFDEHPGIPASNLQRAMHSIHFYPYMCVIEKHQFPTDRLIAPKHGTEWQPFL